jgi:hypothetical protein
MIAPIKPQEIHHKNSQYDIFVEDIVNEINETLESNYNPNLRKTTVCLSSYKYTACHVNEAIQIFRDVGWKITIIQCPHHGNQEDFIATLEYPR